MSEFVYLLLYDERQGLNPLLPDSAFVGPVIGPLTAVCWRRGTLVIEYIKQTFVLKTTEYGDHILYGENIYNSFRVVTYGDLVSYGYTCCGHPLSVHPVDIFSVLINF